MKSSAIISIIIAVFGTCLASDYHCRTESEEGYTLTLDFQHPHGSAISLCTYAANEMESRAVRNCRWKMKIPSTVSTAQVMLELSFTDRHSTSRVLNVSTFNVRGTAFAGILSIESMFGTCPTKQPRNWNPDLRFQLLPLKNNSDYVSIELNIDTTEKANVSDLFQLNAFYSNSSMCSRGLLYHRGMCYAVRDTDSMAQAAVRFTDEAGIRDVLKAYLSARKEMDDWSNSQFKHTEMKLAASYCSALHSLMYWDHDDCSCHVVPIPSANRRLSGEGDCVSLSANLSETGAMSLRRVSCAVAMPTLLSFPATPAAVHCGDPGGTPRSRCSAAARQRACDLRCRDGQTTTTTTTTTTPTTTTPTTTTAAPVETGNAIWAVVAPILLVVVVIAIAIGVFRRAGSNPDQLPDQNVQQEESTVGLTLNESTSGSGSMSDSTRDRLFKY